MVAYNFQARFADQVEQGGKRQTIRAHGKRRHARQGDALQLYTGMRTRSCRKLRDAICNAAAIVLIDRDINGLAKIEVEGQRLDALEKFAFATADGFSSAGEMVDWFEQQHGLPFSGVCIQW